MLSYLKNAKATIEKTTFYSKDGSLFYLSSSKHKNFIINSILPDETKSVLFSSEREVMIDFAYKAFKYINPLTYRLPYFVYTFAVSDGAEGTYSFYTDHIEEHVNVLKLSEKEKIEILLHTLYAHHSTLQNERITIRPGQEYFFKTLDEPKLFPIFDRNVGGGKTGGGGKTFQKYYLKTDSYPVFYDIHSMSMEEKEKGSGGISYKKGYDIFYLILQFYTPDHPIHRYVLQKYSKYGKNLNSSFFSNYLKDEDDPFSFEDIFNFIIDQNFGVVDIITSDDPKFSSADVYTIQPDTLSGKGIMTFSEMNFTLKYLKEIRSITQCSKTSETLKCKINDLIAGASKGHSSGNSLLRKLIDNSKVSLKNLTAELDKIEIELDSRTILSKFKIDENEIFEIFTDEYHTFFTETFYNIQNFILGYKMLQDEISIIKNILREYEDDGEIFKKEGFASFDSSKYKSMYKKLSDIVNHNVKIFVPELLGEQPTEQLIILRHSKKNTKYNVYKTHTRSLFSIL